jgi:hypothetical protein
MFSFQLIYLKITGMLFPTSDFWHPVVTPALVCMSQLLTKVCLLPWQGGSAPQFLRVVSSCITATQEAEAGGPLAHKFKTSQDNIDRTCLKRNNLEHGYLLLRSGVRYLTCKNL